MAAIKGTYQHGQVVLDQSVDWPEGCRLVIEPDPSDANGSAGEDIHGDSPEAIARWIAEFEAIPPWDFRPEEEAEWQAARQTVKEYTLAKLKQRFPGGQP